MRKVNFNNLENLQIPDEWTKNALALPTKLNTGKPSSAVPLFYRRLAFAACFILVCVLSVTLFTLTDNDATPPVHIEPTGKIVQTESYAVSPSQNAVKKPTQETQSVDPTEEPTIAETVNITETTADIDNGSSEANGVTNPDKTPSSSKPSQATQPQTEPTKPSESEGIEIPEGPCVCVGYIPESLLCGSSTVYCYIEPNNPDYAAVETEPTLYLATVRYTNNGYVYISFDGTNSEDAKFSDYYNFYFLNADNELIYTSSEYVIVD